MFPLLNTLDKLALGRVHSLPLKPYHEISITLTTGQGIVWFHIYHKDLKDVYVICVYDMLGLWASETGLEEPGQSFWIVSVKSKDRYGEPMKLCFSEIYNNKFIDTVDQFLSYLLLAEI